VLSSASRSPRTFAPRSIAWASFYLACGGVASGCSRSSGATPEGSASIAASAAPATPAAPVVDHGELDTKAPADSPMLAATVIAATVYKLPNTSSRKLGYLRLGNVVRRDPKPVPGQGCKGDFYHVYPMGYVCTDEATTDLELPLVRAAGKRAALDKPLPYKYGFVRATAPQYLRIPTKAEQSKSEFKLDEHMAWYAEHRAEVQTVILGANDVPLDARGVALPGLAHPKGFRASTALSENELFGGDGPEDPIPFWLQGGRQIPNVSGFNVPASAVFADRVRRKTGLSFVDAFLTESEDLKRRFAVTVDLRLIPTTKVKPDTGSPFHGIAVPAGLAMPFAWVLKSDSKSYRIEAEGGEASPAGDAPKRALVPLSGKATISSARRYYQTRKDPKQYLAAADLGIVAPPPTWPEVAEKGQKWIDISLVQQTLVLYEGKRPFYATLISSGRDRLGDPENSLATPRGTFRIQSKHIAAAMDSQENSNVSGGTRSHAAPASAETRATIERLKAAKKKGEKLDEDDQRRLINIEKGRDPEYGITMRRGSANFELRDVPWIQYFASGYALHGAYWHDVFGIPRSHGCVNLSPIDARVVFNWTDPPVPEGWHGINVGSDMGEGTTVVVRE
jgi:lipoprotein-anchoring transpeptidase ErfK/SrfK